MSVPAASGPRLHYAWVVAVATFVTLLMAAGMRAAPGVLIGPLHDAFGWGTADVGLAVSVNVLLFGFMGPFAAALLVRYGLRTVVPCALALVALGSGLSATVTARWQLVLYWGVFVGIGTGCMAAVLAATVANRWFVARRGLITGALMAASASGQVMFFQVLCRELCGAEWATVAYGWLYAGHQLGASLAAWGAGEIRDRAGSYQLAFLVAAGCCLVASVGVLHVGRRPIEGAMAASAPAA